MQIIVTSRDSFKNQLEELKLSYTNLIEQSQNMDTVSKENQIEKILQQSDTLSQ